MRSGFLNACPPSEVSMSGSSIALEKGIRNKRKFRTDHIQAPSATAPTTFDFVYADDDGECCSSWTTHTSCSPNSVVINLPSTVTTPGVMVSGLCHGCCKDDSDYTDLQEPDWDKSSESQLEDILISMLDALYKDAVAEIVSLGHSQQDALNAVLKNGRWNGKDALGSVVESSMTWLQSGKATQGILDFTNLKDMERHILAEMVCLLRKVRPFLSKGDAMWCLLVCDMNLLLACAMEDDVATKESPVVTSLCLNSKTTSRSRVQNTANSAVPLSQQTPSLSQAVVHLSNGTACKHSLGSLVNLSSDNRSAFSTLNFSSSRVGKVAVASRQTNIYKSPSIPKSAQPLPVRSCSNQSSAQEFKSQALNTSNLHKVVAAKVEVSEQQKLGLTTSKYASGDDPCCNAFPLSKDCLKVNMNPADVCAVITKEKHVLKILRNHCLAQTFQTILETAPGEQEALYNPNSGPVRLKCRQHSCAPNLEGKKADLQTLMEKHGLPGFSNDIQLESTVDAMNSWSVHETDLCLATTTATSSEISGSLQVVSCKEVSTRSPSYHVTNQTSRCNGLDQEQRNTELLLQLIERVKYLESQLLEWSDWAQQKVMQAAQRLRKDSSELKALRLERDEYACLKREKETLEDSTMKKLSEMENALRKALNQVDRANTTARRLKAENAEVRAEMEATKLTATEYVSACQEVAKKESKSVKKAQVWEKQKTKLQVELTQEKRQLTIVLQQLSQAKERHQQAEVRWRREKKAKEEALALVDFDKKAKEKVELAFKRQEEALRRKAEAESQCQCEEVRRLQCEISHLKTSLGLQPALTWSHSRPEILQSCSAESYKQINARLLAEIASLRNSQRGIQRDRECVMCMNEEVSIVFLPCAHQVICIKCNELHLKRGLKDCPSCRTPIQQRVRVYGVNLM